MLFALYVLVALSLTGLVLLLRAAFSAPYGDEDKLGFHLTSPVEEERPAFPAKIVLSTDDLTFFQH